jgi:hypothetical protein
MPEEQALLHLLHVPEFHWEMISLDCTAGLPTSSGYDSIMVIIYYLTKMGHFVPTASKASAVEVAHMFVDNSFRLHGLPKNIVSNRDHKFGSKLWKAVFQYLQTKLNFSTAYHSQTDGQTELLNQTLEIKLRNYCSSAPKTLSVV